MTTEPYAPGYTSTLKIEFLTGGDMHRNRIHQPIRLSMGCCGTDIATCCGARAQEFDLHGQEAEAAREALMSCGRNIYRFQFLSGNQQAAD